MLDYSREFIVLATCLNYTKAARTLNVSQSSLSRHISDLEKELGFQLLERNPLELTSAGRFYLESMNSVIDQLDSIVEQGRSLALRDDQELSMYMLPARGLYARIVYEAVARLRVHQPGFSPRFCYTDRMYSAIDAVVDGKADVGVLLAEPSNLPEGIACEWLANSPAMLWLHEDNPLLAAPSLSLEDVATCYVLRSTTQSALVWYEGMVDVFRSRGLEPKVRLRDLENKESFYLALRPDEVLVATDEGESVCPYNPHLVGIRFDDLNLCFSVHLVYPEKPSSAARRFVAACRQVAEEFAK